MTCRAESTPYLPNIAPAKLLSCSIRCVVSFLNAAAKHAAGATAIF